MSKWRGEGLSAEEAAPEQPAGALPVDGAFAEATTEEAAPMYAAPAEMASEEAALEEAIPVEVAVVVATPARRAARCNWPQSRWRRA